MKRVAVAFTGPSNSGKTTLIVKIAQKLIPDNRVAVVKHDPKDKALFDTEGKDSYKFTQTGAHTIVVSPTRTTYFAPESKTIDDIIQMVQDFDYLLVEGLKTLPLPRIAIFRGKIDESYFPYSEAIAIDESVDIRAYEIPEEISVLDLNNIDEILAWINAHAKKV
ncbi:MAG: molybdopterin-guanine dinucleotide biosynthesis protein B [Sulfurospirillum sp.]|nr:MAG: molybdopterin-guanine dinucleotide biosynthesis protein B [Sulfurospirillum sp.]